MSKKNHFFAKSLGFNCLIFPIFAISFSGCGPSTTLRTGCPTEDSFRNGDAEKRIESIEQIVVSGCGAVPAKERDRLGSVSRPRRDGRLK